MANSTENLSLIENLRLELRRGCLVLAVLAELRSRTVWIHVTQRASDRGMVVDEGTLYPLLRRLESQGLLVSEWREEDKRNKRFYRFPATASRAETTAFEWQDIGISLEQILKESGNGTS